MKKSRRKEEDRTRESEVYVHYAEHLEEYLQNVGSDLGLVEVDVSESDGVEKLFVVFVGDVVEQLVAEPFLRRVVNAPDSVQQHRLDVGQCLLEVQCVRGIEVQRRHHVLGSRHVHVVLLHDVDVLRIECLAVDRSSELARPVLVHIALK